MKIVINKCYGGFGLSDKAVERLLEMGMTASKYTEDGNLPNGVDFSISEPSSFLGKYYAANGDDKEFRSDPRVVKVVEELGGEASSSLAKLEVVEIPDDVEWEIEEYDGIEWIAEAHRTW